MRRSRTDPEGVSSAMPLQGILFEELSLSICLLGGRARCKSRVNGFLILLRALARASLGALLPASPSGLLRSRPTLGGRHSRRSFLTTPFSGSAKELLGFRW